jgi:GT2 family glycosyltransferase
VRPDVGIVGARLLYDDGRVQHAGVVFDQECEVIHQLRLSDATDPGPDGELALTRTVSAVTGACLCLRRSVFFEIGQLDERNLAVNFNDIDLCLRAGDHGYRVVVTPFAGLIHYESASRDPRAAAAQEAYLRERHWFQVEWGCLLATDPFHNPNLAYGWTGTRMASRRPSPTALAEFA